IDAALASNAHTYRLLIVKERYSVLLICCSRAIDKALCLSAAKKEEYEAFSAFRQPSFFPTSLSICMHRSARGRIIALGCASRKGYFSTLTAQQAWPSLQAPFCAACRNRLA
ncbi:hypothetical protein, partial [Janthinobacterium sp.]|uniref:hypothetical protein n=1 Tax=Janthinobacterium sp. TaxID=1871054 RepID=UPI0026034E6D